MMRLSLILVALGASALADDAFVPFVEQPGVQEFSGHLYVRPLQVADLVELGAAMDDAEQTYADALALIGARIVSVLEATDDYVVSLPDGMDENTYGAQLVASGLFEYVHPDWICYPTDTVPNDPAVGGQWQHAKIQSYKAWDIHTGENDIIVAIVDTGVDHDHPDLGPNLVPGFNTPSNLAEINGGVTDDFNGHGTFSAGCAAAIGNNAYGVVGVGWDFSIMPIKVTVGAQGGAPFSELTQGAQWAAVNGAKAVNVSFSGVNNSGVNTTGAFVKSQGALLCWSAGNDNAQLTNDHAHVIVVGATNPGDGKAGFSNWGAPIDITAPGENVRSTTLGGGNGISSGTSFSSPIVAGAVALVFSANGDLEPEEVEQLLYDGAVDLGAVGEDIFFGNGRLDTFQTLLAMGDLGGDPTLIPLPFFEDAEDFVLDETEWHVVSGAEVSGAAVNEPSGFNSIELDENDLITTQQLETLELLKVPLTPLFVSFWSEHRQVEAGKELLIEYYSELDQAWNILDTLVSTGENQTEFDFYEYEMPLDAYGDQLQVRFSFQGDASDSWYLDDIGVGTEPAGGCLADFNADGMLSILDFVAFQVAFAAGEDAADCNADGVLSVLDFVCFQQAFVAGCP